MNLLRKKQKMYFEKINIKDINDNKTFGSQKNHSLVTRV